MNDFLNGEIVFNLCKILLFLVFVEKPLSPALFFCGQYVNVCIKERPSKFDTDETL